VGVVEADEIGVVVRRLARPDGSGGMVIERSVILAEGSGSDEILRWISDHDGVADSTTAPARGGGLHGLRETAAAADAPARRFVLPARAFD
jgi:hypothetical protein